MRGRAICACYALYAESPFTVPHKIQQIHVWALPSVVWNPGKFAQLVVVILWQSYAVLDQPTVGGSL